MMIALIINCRRAGGIMFQNRLLALQESATVGMAVPRPQFVFCPAGLTPFVGPAQMGWQHSVYELALEQARAAVAAPLQQKLFSVWN
jgi:hypothetical protein